MRKRWPWILSTLLVALAAGAFLGDRALHRRGHPGLATFLGQWARNYPKSFAVDPPVIRITVDEQDMAVLEAVVERAREAGVIEQEEGGEVPGRFEADGQAFKGKLRIKGKMTDHVKGRKWSFRVTARKDGGFLGMKRFSLQHPGTRNYLCDWFYHRLMKGEGLVALRYGFCRVELNGEDLGIYAYEEHFGPELLENNGRLEGPLVRFDPGLFWRHRLNGVEGIKVDDAYGAYQAAALDAYGTKDIAADPKQRKQFEQALAVMEAFRNGELPASAVFDVDRTARRLALLDLIGGYRSMDWSDVKFYFDPAMQRLEPVSYESFSAFPLRELGAAYRCTGPFRPDDELHTALFKAPAIFAAYVHHLERMGRTAYLDSAFSALSGALDTASATLYGEFPYKELDRGLYYKNQEAIRTLLGLPKGFHAYAQGLKHDTLDLLLVPVESLPVQMDSLELADGRRIAAATPTVLPARQRGQVGRPMAVRFAVPGATDSLLALGMKLGCHIPGASVRKQVEVFPFALEAVEDARLDAHKAPNVPSFPFLVVDERARTITIPPGAWTIDRDLVIPAGYVVNAFAPLKLSVVGGAEVISRSPLQWVATADAPILITSPDSSSKGIHVLEAGGRSRLEHVHLLTLQRKSGARADLSFYRSDATLEHVVFRGTASTVLDVALGELRMDACSFERGGDQLRTHFAQAQLSATRFAGAADDAITVEGGGLSVSNGAVESASGIGCKASVHAQVALTGCAVASGGAGLESKQGALITMQGGTLRGAPAAHAGKSEMRYGPPRIRLENVAVPDGPGAYDIGAGGVIDVDGRPVRDAMNTAAE